MRVQPVTTMLLAQQPACSLKTVQATAAHSVLGCSLQAYSKQMLTFESCCQARQPTKSELNATAVLALNLDEVSAKVRVGNKTEDEERDKGLPIWSGIVHLILPESGWRGSQTLDLKVNEATSSPLSGKLVAMHLGKVSLAKD